MNQELKQRLIGAIVVTALAAIFIPMLFDDPINKSGQSVTELEIPAHPNNLEEASSNKLPNNSKQVLETSDSTSENLINTEEETELSSETLPPTEVASEDEQTTETVKTSPQQPAEFKETSQNESPLDTGIIDEQNRVISSKNTQQIVKSIESQIEQPIINAPIKEASKKTISLPAKTIVKSIPLTENTNNESTNNNQPKIKSKLNRWSIQAGSFSKKENAVTLLENLKKQGLPVTLDTVNAPDNTIFYRLKVGPTLDKKRATEMKAKLDNQKIQSLMIVE